MALFAIFSSRSDSCSRKSSRLSFFVSINCLARSSCIGMMSSRVNKSVNWRNFVTRSLYRFWNDLYSTQLVCCLKRIQMQRKCWTLKMIDENQWIILSNTHSALMSAIAACKRAVSALLWRKFSRAARYFWVASSHCRCSSADRPSCRSTFDLLSANSAFALS